jgi:hypothetical protein
MKLLNSGIVTALCLILAAGMLGLVSAEAVNSFSDFFQVLTPPSSPASGKSRLWVGSAGQQLACLNSDGSSCYAAGQPQTGITKNFYITTTGSDSNACTSGSPCATFARVLSLIPSVVASNYVINVADGTYNQAIDGRGYTGYLSITITGDTTTPTNVALTGTLSGCAARHPGTHATICLQGPATTWTIQGISTTSTVRNALFCDNCSAILSNDTFAGTTTAGINVERGYVTLQNAITVSGFSVGDITDSSFGIDETYGSQIIQDSGTLTISGPGFAGGLQSYGITEEFGANFSIVPPTDSSPTGINITITSVLNGIQLSGHSGFQSFVSTGTISITNSSLASGAGLQLSNATEVDMSPTALTISNFATCVNAVGLVMMSQGPGNRSFSCTTPSNAAQGSQVILF